MLICNLSEKYQFPESHYEKYIIKHTVMLRSNNQGIYQIRLYLVGEASIQRGLKRGRFLLFQGNVLENMKGSTFIQN